MLIYKVPNGEIDPVTYVCDSQATIDVAPEIVKALCIVGTQADADSILANNQQNFLQQNLSLFIVDLQTTVEGGVNWSVVDLNTEPQNTDREYFVYSPVTGTYTGAVGLIAAQELLQQTKQSYLVFVKMNSYTTLTSWSKKP